MMKKALFIGIGMFLVSCAGNDVITRNEISNYLNNPSKTSKVNSKKVLTLEDLTNIYKPYGIKIPETYRKKSLAKEVYTHVFWENLLNPKVLEGFQHGVREFQFNISEIKKEKLSTTDKIGFNTITIKYPKVFLRIAQNCKTKGGYLVANQIKANIMARLNLSEYTNGKHRRSIYYPTLACKINNKIDDEYIIVKFGGLRLRNRIKEISIGYKDLSAIGFLAIEKKDFNKLYRDNVDKKVFLTFYGDTIIAYINGYNKYWKER